MTTPMLLEYGGPPRMSTASPPSSNWMRSSIASSPRHAPKACPAWSTWWPPAVAPCPWGAGADQSVLSWIDEDADHPYLLSKGETSEGRDVEFYYGNQMSQFPPGAVIPVETARQAMRDFLLTGQLPTNVEWAE
jgi:hypothetical protein